LYSFGYIRQQNLTNKREANPAGAYKTTTCWQCDLLLWRGDFVGKTLVLQELAHPAFDLAI
jgi:hypothetical protein